MAATTKKTAKKTAKKAASAAPDPSVEAATAGPATDDGTDALQPVMLSPIKQEHIIVPITGKTPLIVHRFSEKAKKEMLENQNKTRTRTKRPPQNPEAEFQASKYLMDDGREAFPAVAFKAAMVGAARLFEGVTMVMLKQALRVHGDGPDQLVPIIGESRMREDVPRASGTTHLRYRAEYWPWRVLLTISYVPTVIDQASVLALIDAAGIGGVGEWRPSAPKSMTGSYGTFEVSRDDEVMAIAP